MAREYVRSRSYQWAAGSRIPVDLSFLVATLAKYKSPVIEEIILRGYINITTGGGTTFQNYDQCAAAVADFVWKDRKGERIHLTGRELRLAAQMEFGSRFQDPADVGVGTTTDIEVLLPITFVPTRARRRADFRPSVAEMTSGEVIWTCSGATPVTGVTINSGTVEIVAVVTDEVVPEAASRMCWLAVNATLSEDNYPLGGACRYAFMYAPPTGTNSDLQSLAGTNYDLLNSYTLDMSDVRRTVLKSTYSRETPDFDATNDEVSRNNVIPLIYPNEDQKITAMRDIDRLHVRLTAALPTGGRLVYNVITDRDPTLTAAALKLPPQALAAADLDVATPKGGRPGAAVGLDAARKMPVRLA